MSNSETSKAKFLLRELANEIRIRSMTDGKISGDPEKALLRVIADVIVSKRQEVVTNPSITEENDNEEKCEDFCFNKCRTHRNSKH